MTNFLNIIHYCFYLFFVKLDYWFNKANPFLLIYKIPFIQRYHRKHNWNPYVQRKKVWNDQKYGFNIIIAGGILTASLIGIFISLVFSVNNIFKLYENIPIYFIAISGVLGYLICFVCVFKGHKYLNYFKKYQFWNTKKRRGNVFFSFLYVVFVMILIFICVFKN